MERAEKPLGIKAYGSIGHLPGSRLGPADHKVEAGQADIVINGRKPWTVYAQTKLDGSCVSAALVDDELIPLGRAGYRAESSPYRMHHLWADYVQKHRNRFLKVLRPGERIVGEWLAMAHGTKYDLRERDPFVAFDIMTDHVRLPTMDFISRANMDFEIPDTIKSHGDPEELITRLDSYGADAPEGVVYRAERDGKVQFLAKWVNPTKIDGCYLNDPACEVWNWQP